MFLLEFHVRYYIFRGIFRIFVISKIFISNEKFKIFFYIIQVINFLFIRNFLFKFFDYKWLHNCIQRGICHIFVNTRENV